MSNIGEELADACWSGDLVTVQRLVEREGVSIEVESGDRGWRPLILASWCGRLNVVQYLLERGTHVAAKDRSGSTALSFAASEGFLDIAKLLVEHDSTSVNIADENGRTPLWLAGIGAEVSATDMEKKSPLIWACEEDNFKVAKWLAGFGADVNAADIRGRTPLLWVCQWGDFEMVKWLVGVGANMNAADMKGNTPLSWACQCSNFEIAEWLAQMGAEVNAADTNGKKALVWACLKSHFEMVKLLLSLKADQYLVDNSGRTARDYATQNIKELLLVYTTRDQLTSSNASIPVTSSPQWLIYATDIEFRKIESTKVIGGDLLERWLDSDIVTKLWTSNAATENLAYKEQADRWFALRHPNIRKFYGAVHEGHPLLCGQGCKVSQKSREVNRPIVTLAVDDSEETETEDEEIW